MNKMKLMQEYKTQGIYILFGFIVLLFPFLKPVYFLPGFIACAFVFSRFRPGSSLFSMFARESDIRAGKLTGMIQLFLVMAFLFAIGLIVDFDKFPLFIIGGAFAITTFGDGIADLINIYEKSKKENTQNNMKIYSAKSSIVFLVSGSVFAFLASAWIYNFTLGAQNTIPYGMLFFLAVLGALTGALLESITANQDNIIIPFGSAMTIWLFYTFSYNVDTLYLIKVIIFAFILGYLAYRARIADISAMLSATLLGVVIIISTDINSFFILLAFFLLGSVFTRYKYSYKLAQGTAEKKGGVRGYKNVFANSIAALALAVAIGIFPAHRLMLLTAYLGSIATACGDTLASEIGETYKGEPRMITTLKKVKPGTDGGVSPLGEFAAFCGAAAIAFIAFLIMPEIRNDLNLVLIVIAGGFIGTNIDSVLGATFQQKGYLSNNGVNLLATIFGAIVTGILYYLMGS